MIVPSQASNVVHLVDRESIRPPLGDVLGKRVTLQFKAGGGARLSDTLRRFVPELKVMSGGAYNGSGPTEWSDEEHVSDRDFSVTNTPLRDCLMGTYPVERRPFVCPLMWVAEVFDRPNTNPVVRIKYRHCRLGSLGP